MSNIYRKREKIMSNNFFDDIWGDLTDAEIKDMARKAGFDPTIKTVTIGKFKLQSMPDALRKNKAELLSPETINNIMNYGVTNVYNINRTPLTIESYKQAVNDLCDKMTAIIDNKLPYNIFDFLPKTKNGDLDIRPISAIAFCPYGYYQNGYISSGLTKAGIKIEIIDPTTAFISLNSESILTTPLDRVILQDINNPINLKAIVKPTFLDKNLIKPGFVYENEKGKEHLYLGSDNARGKATYYYMVMSPKWSKIFKDNNINTYNDLIKYVDALSHENTPNLLTSVSPRKFVKEIRCQVIGYTKPPVDMWQIFY